MPKITKDYIVTDDVGNVDEIMANHLEISPDMLLLYQGKNIVAAYRSWKKILKKIEK